ncbi:lipoprotein-releasing system ATP-binding protein LolD [Bdellovibrio sp. qaytius]|nr:lipoprotein-releasing system ATP-binding protein LolD [Bdellovibrio sp. qaytius]
MIQVQGLRKHYITGSSHVSVLRGVDLNIQAGEAVCLLGSSGAGKSTLLQILGTLDRPTEGEVLFEGSSLFEKNDDQLALFRNETMGFVFQFHHLIHELSALENVMLPGLLAKLSKEETKQKALEWLDFMGLAERAHHYPNQLSGGELQRVAIARALIRNPRILLADEPTGNLDSENSAKIQGLFFELQKKLGLTLIVVTHDLQFAQAFSKIYRMKDGYLTSN